MLIEFAVENFLSFKQRVTFSMRAAPLGDLHPHHVFTEYSDAPLLKSACVYGANASGKTNLLRAMSFMRHWVRNSVRNTEVGEQIPVERFRLSTETDSEPSRFEIIFAIANTVYHYGFAADSERIREEWLTLSDDTMESNFFRRTGSDIALSPQFAEGKELTNKVRPNSLFLSVVAQFNGPIATAIVSWFQNLRFYLNDESDLATLTEVLSDATRKEEFLKYVRHADLSIQDILVEELPQPPVDPGLDLPPSSSPSESPPGPSSPPLQILIRRMRRMRPPTVHFLHQKFDADQKTINSLESFRFSNESAGTRKFLTLLVPILEALRNGSLLVVDELDTRFHTLLVQAILGLFNSEQNLKAQLIFTTHTTSILHHRFLRPDQIWFSEKNPYGATDLYSLIEYKLTENEFSERDYVQGRYGAIPFLGDFRSLLS